MLRWQVLLRRLADEGECLASAYLPMPMVSLTLSMVDSLE